MSSKIISNKKDSSVSSVIGTIVLLALVVTSTAVVAVTVISNINDNAQVGSIISFEASADPYRLYHAGGDPIQLSQIYILYTDKYGYSREITEYSKIIDDDKEQNIMSGDSLAVEIWNTGEALAPVYMTEDVKVSEILIVSTLGGKAKEIYKGSDYVGGITVPTPTVGPTVDKYTITVIQDYGGFISPMGPLTVDYGGSIEFTIIVYDKHKIEWLRVNGVDVNLEDLTQLSSNIYSYTLNRITSDTTVEVKYKVVNSRINLIIRPYTYVSSDNHGVIPFNVPEEYTINTPVIVKGTSYNMDRGHGVNITVSDFGDYKNVTSIEITRFTTSSSLSKIPGLSLQAIMAKDGKSGTDKLSFRDGVDGTRVKDQLPSSYHFWIEPRGNPISSIPDYSTNDKQLDNVEIDVKVTYDNDDVEYFYFNETNTEIDFIPQRYVGLRYTTYTDSTINPDMSFDIGSYSYSGLQVSPYLGRGVYINLTEAANTYNVAYYTVQDVSGVFNNKSLDYDTILNSELTNINLRENFSESDIIKDIGHYTPIAETNKPYYYSIPFSADPSGAAHDNVKFLITAYYIDYNIEEWRSVEIVKELDIPAYSDIVSGLSVEPFGYDYGDQIGHGINITVASLSGFPTGKSIALEPEIYANGKTYKISSGLTYVGSDDVNNIEIGKKYTFEISPNNLVNLNEITANKITVYGNIEGSRTVLYQDDDGFTIPAGSPYYTDPNFPNITLAVSGYYKGAVPGQTGVGHGLCINVETSPYEYLGYTVKITSSGLNLTANTTAFRPVFWDDTIGRIKYTTNNDLIYIRCDVALSHNGDTTLSNTDSIHEGDEYYFWIGPGGGELNQHNPRDQAFYGDVTVNVTVSGTGNGNYYPLNYNKKIYGVNTIWIPSRFENTPQPALLDETDVTINSIGFNFVGNEFDISTYNSNDARVGDIYLTDGKKYCILKDLPSGFVGNVNDFSSYIGEVSDSRLKSTGLSGYTKGDLCISDNKLYINTGDWATSFNTGNPWIKIADAV